MDPKELVADVAALVSFPEAAARVIELLDDSESTTQALGAAICLDPALASRVLRMANSAYYARSREVDTVPRAVAVLGRSQLRSLTVGLSAIRAFEGIPIEAVSMDEFWSHSIYCGLVAEQVAREGRPGIADSAFVAGLLHDIGQLVLFMRTPAQAARALMRAAESGDEISVAVAEAEILGFDHTEVGQELARRWSLPDSLIASIGYHHRPSLASQHAELVATVHIANSGAILAETECADLSGAAPIDSAAWTLAGVDAGAMPALLKRAQEQFQAVHSSMVG